MIRMLIALALAALVGASGTARATPEACDPERFGTAVDAAGAALRKFNADAQPRLKLRLKSLKEKKGWPDAGYEERGLEYISDDRSAALDKRAGDLLAKVDTLGRPEAGKANCAQLEELEAAGAELLSVMKEKSAYLDDRIAREIGEKPAAEPAPAAKAEPKATAKKDADKKEPERKEAQNNEPRPSPAPKAEPRPEGKDLAGKAPPSKPVDNWDTKTAAAPPPPPSSTTEGAPVGEPYAPVDPSALPPGAADAEGYTIDEIQEASRGFFGTISASLGSVIEHAFSTAGRPTGYVLGTEGGGAFLAGLRYGSGTLYLRAGGTQTVYWHGPSVGYDIGAEGSRTLFLIYRLQDPSRLFRMFTGIDGSAYLVGGVGMTLLKGGEVIMAPIRSGIGLRLGANIGYVRFTPQQTWNPF